MLGLLKTGSQPVVNRFLHIKNCIKPVESSPSCSFSIFGPKTGLNRTLKHYMRVVPENQFESNTARTLILGPLRRPESPKFFKQVTI